MNPLRLLACTLCAMTLAVLESGCSSVSSSPTPVPVRQMHTYAIIAMDDQGVLSQTELNKIEDSLVQFLLDQGYVLGNQTLVADAARADAVFRIKISWNTEHSSFAIVDIAPNYSGAYASANPLPAEGGAIPWPPSAEELPPPPWPYDDWVYDPWLYGYNSGYAYGPYCPFLPFFPVFGYYGWEHHRRSSPPIEHRPEPDHRLSREHRPEPDQRPPFLTRDRGDGPPWRTVNQPGRPILWSRFNPPTSGREHAAPPADATRHVNNPGPGHHDLPAGPSTSRPQVRTPGNRPPAAPQEQTAARVQVPRDISPRNESRTPARRQDSPSRPPPTAVAQRDYAQPQRVSPSAAAMPARDSSAPARSSPPRQREYSAPPQRDHSPAPQRDYSPPPQRDYSPPPSPPPPPPTPSPASSNSGNDSRSSSRDRER